jgi:hypothetical protein
MNLGAQDLRLLKAYVGGEASGSSPKFTIARGGRLDGNWIGGTNIAEWKGGVIRLNTDLGSKAAQTVHRKLKSLAKVVWGPGTRKVLYDYEWKVKNLQGAASGEPVVTLKHLKPRPAKHGKKMTWANMLGPITGKL